MVLCLVIEKLRNGHSVFMDNFYNSVNLASIKLPKNTYCTGTLHIDQKNNPEDVKNSNLKKSETIAWYGGSIMVEKW